MLQRLDLARRARAAAIHLAISAAVAALAALLVFGLWYPGPFRLLAGGRGLFFLLISVDVVLGPLLTFAIFDVRKGWKHLQRDLAVIGLIQTSALAYGLHTVFVVRPVAMVFEVDRVRLVTAADVHRAELAQAQPSYRSLPLTGPWLLGTRAPATPAEHTDALFMGLKGIDIGQRPIFWQPYERSLPKVLERSRPVSLLFDHYPQRVEELRRGLADMGADTPSARFLPTVARGDWVAVIDKTGAVLGYLPVDGFF
jgi:hypothetical protein